MARWGVARCWLAALAALILVGAPVQALAGVGDVSDGDSNAAGTQSDHYRHCVLWGGPSGFGGTCLTPGSSSLKDEFKGVPFPICEDLPVPPGTPLPDAFKDGDGGQHYLEICLKNGNLDDDAALDNGLTRTSKVVWIPTGQPVKTLLPGPAAALRDATGVYPPPVPMLGPSQFVRVNIPSYVWLDPAQTSITKTVESGNGLVTMTAHVVSLKVIPDSRTPDSKSPEMASCTGSGTSWFDTPRTVTALTATAGPAECKVTYPRSSAAAPQAAYTMVVSSSWQVDWHTADGTRHGTFGPFDVPNNFAVAVNDVESLNN